MTFDDVTELLSAQRKAAWADVARRIAHEIKNPLTPIQLSAERLKRRFAKEITSDPESFTQCADTIVRHVGDIGRMVDEFSTFARMPAPVMRPESLERDRARGDGAAARRAAADRLGGRNRRAAARRLRPPADRPGADEFAAKCRGCGGDARGCAAMSRCACALTATMAVLSVTDDGIGLPDTDRARLTEPYVTHKPKGTGLGLAIVRKIMEDHGGRLELEDSAGRFRREGESDPPGNRGGAGNCVARRLRSCLHDD